MLNELIRSTYFTTIHPYSNIDGTERSFMRKQSFLKYKYTEEAQYPKDTSKNRDRPAKYLSSFIGTFENAMFLSSVISGFHILHFIKIFKILRF